MLSSLVVSLSIILICKKSLFTKEIKIKITEVYEGFVSVDSAILLC